MLRLFRDRSYNGILFAFYYCLFIKVVCQFHISVFFVRGTMSTQVCEDYSTRSLCANIDGFLKQQRLIILTGILLATNFNAINVVKLSKSYWCSCFKQCIIKWKYLYRKNIIKNNILNKIILFNWKKYLHVSKKIAVIVTKHVLIEDSRGFPKLL